MRKPIEVTVHESEFSDSYNQPTHLHVLECTGCGGLVVCLNNMSPMHLEPREVLELAGVLQVGSSSPLVTPSRIDGGRRYFVRGAQGGSMMVRWDPQGDNCAFVITGKGKQEDHLKAAWLSRENRCRLAGVFFESVMRRRAAAPEARS